MFASSTAFAGDTITVRPGDTLWALARAHGVSVPELQAANGLRDDRLSPGMTLRLPGAPEAAATAPAQHVVVSGDTLYDIARAYRVSVDDLIVWNRLDGTIIRPGQTLSLGATPGVVVAAPLVVTVQPGNTLWQLARVHDTTIAAIAATNGLDPSGTLRVGQSLTIPGRYAGVASPSGDPSPDVGGPAPAVIVVNPGDTLWQLAHRHGSSVSAIMALNGLEGDRLRVGQSLRIVPGGDLAPAAASFATPRPEVAPTGMVWPLVGAITSRFGYRRLRIGGSNMHYGLDIDGDIGDPIRSATAGTVVFAGWRGGYGQLVIVQHGATEYYYAHASAILVSEGQLVSPGQVIARVGITGNVTGPHLHFEIRVDGTAVDPLPILEARASR
jgi:murein DD-endopeptidase MepM/ murein hydrolase activator NlpD